MIQLRTLRFSHRADILYHCATLVDLHEKVLVRSTQDLCVWSVAQVILRTFRRRAVQRLVRGRRRRHTPLWRRSCTRSSKNRYFDIFVMIPNEFQLVWLVNIWGVHTGSFSQGQTPAWPWALFHKKS